jgi:hypothetical protein
VTERTWVGELHNNEARDSNNWSRTGAPQPGESLPLWGAPSFLSSMASKMDARTLLVTCAGAIGLSLAVCGKITNHSSNRRRDNERCYNVSGISGLAS